MKRTPGPWIIVLAILLIVTLSPTDQQMLIWDAGLMPLGRTRQRRNPRRNRERWARRLGAWRRRRPLAPKRKRRMKRPVGPTVTWAHHRQTPAHFRAVSKRRSPQKAPAPSQRMATEDPLADLRQGRGLIDLIEERTLWAMLIRIVWPNGPVCPHCGERELGYLKEIDPDYRGGLGRWQCRVCAEAGDPGEGGTFTPLTGTVLDGMRLDVRTLWLIAASFAQGQASVETAKEAQVNRHTTDRLFRLCRAALYEGRSTELLTLTVEDIIEMDEVYITAGLKGRAGGLELEREPRQRGLKRRGRGTWDSDRLPVFGLICRGGEVRLFVLRNVQTETIRPIVEQMVQRGAHVYTDGYCIYHFLSRQGYRHQSVNHGGGEYALDLDGDGQCEVHCNTVECTWSWLRQMVRTYRGVSKVYLPLYVAQFEFLYNRRHQNHWNRTLDVLQMLFQVDATRAAELLRQVETAEFAEVCPVAG
jgi:transposase